jgi:hypothetical protein
MNDLGGAPKRSVARTSESKAEKLVAVSNDH